MMSSDQTSIEMDDNAIDLDSREKTTDEQSNNQPTQYLTRSRSIGDDLSSDGTEAVSDNGCRETPMFAVS